MQARRRGRGWFGCLVTAPLGCLSFGVGAIVVGLAMMPSACGRALSDGAEQAFREHHRGWLDVHRAHLPSFFGDQELRLDLEDPERRTVLRARITAPPLPFSEHAVWGPLRIELTDARILFDAEGVTNLERAFEPRASVEPRSRGRLELSYDPLSRIDLALHADELAWGSDAAGEAGLVLRAVSGIGVLAVDQGSRVTLTGSASPGPDASELRFDLVVRDAFAYARGEPYELTLSVASERASTALVEALLGAPGALHGRFGAELERFELVLDVPHDGPPRVLVKIGEETLFVRGRGAALRLLRPDELGE